MSAHRTHSSPSPSRPLNGSVFKFPLLSMEKSTSGRHGSAVSDDSAVTDDTNGITSPTTVTYQESWQPRRKETMLNGFVPSSLRRSRQKSLSEAFRSIKQRRGSVTENAHEVVEALKAPVSPKLIFLCGIWYMTSIFTNASSKAILIAFRYPVTLTVVQFAFVCSWCIISSWLAHRFTSIQTFVPALKYKIRPPSRELITVTLPLTAFQIGGHIMNSDAMSRIPVSLVHTIKGLSPLFTVLAYRFVLRVHYSTPTYLSLIPLTLGVVMACSANVSGDFVGLLGAFGSAILFVTQNIVSKKLFNEAARAEAEASGFQQKAHVQTLRKPDKLNLLCYSSGLALFFTLPIWLWSEGFTLLADLLRNGGVELSRRPDALDHSALALEFIFNGTFHFAQSLVAFVLLSMVSPVTYSVASLIKRVFVITFAVAWFGNPISRIQAAGIGLTFVGLYLYDRTNDAARADRRARALNARAEEPVLPLASADQKFATAAPPILSPAPPPSNHHLGHNLVPPGLANRPPSAGKDKLEDAAGVRATSPVALLPGTKQEETWKAQDMPRANGVAV